jgi:hypothetical protein
MKKTANISKTRLSAVVIIALLAMTMCGDGGDDTGGNNNGNNNGGNPVNNRGKIAYSTDGVTWTAVADTKLNSAILSVAYGNGRWLASTNGAAAGNSMAYSSDGVTWTAVEQRIYSDCINDITFGDGKFVAVGNEGVIAYSTDCVSWTHVTDTTFGADDYVMSAAWGDDKFIAVGYKRNGQGKNYAYSADGVTWTAGSGALGTKSFIAWGNGIWVAAMDWTGIHYSTNGGNTWAYTYVPYEYTSTDALNGGPMDIVWGNDKFVAVGSVLDLYSKDVVVYSSNGKDWTIIWDHPFTIKNGIHSIAYGNGKFIAGGAGGKIAYSSDGITWTAVTNSSFGSDGVVIDIAYGGGKFVAVGY